MPRPKTKEELLNTAQSDFEKLNDMILNLSSKELEIPFDFSDQPNKKEAHWKRDKNIKDVLTHLHEWHMLLINWLESNMNGQAQAFLPEPYNWKTYGDMNIEFFHKHKTTTLEQAKDLVHNSHERVIKLIETFDDKQLFTKAYYDWTGTTSIGSYCVSATTSHYNWAMKKIRAHKKRCKSLCM